MTFLGIGLAMGAGRGGAAAPWYRQLGGVAPVEGWNFKTGQAIHLSASAAFSGLNLTAAGLTVNTGTDVDAKAALLSVVAGNYTVLLVLAGRAGAANAGVIGQGTTESPVFLIPPGNARAYKSPTSLDTTNRFSAGGKRYICMARSGTGRKICQNGTTVVSDSTVQTASPTSWNIGRFNGGSYLNDDIEEMYIFASGTPTDAAMQAACRLPGASPLAPTKYFRGLDQQYIDYGANVFKREADLPWSTLAIVRKTALADTSGTYLGDMVWTTVADTAAPFTGQEAWFSALDGSNLRMHIRIINNVNTPTYLGVTTAAINSLLWGWNVLGWRYAGSRVPGGCDFFVNGVKQTSNVTESNTLGANTTATGTQQLYVGNQKNRLGYYGKFDMARMCLTTDAKSDQWFADHATPETFPVADANTFLDPDFANASGTSVPDLSPSGLTGTASTADLLQAA